MRALWTTAWTGNGPAEATVGTRAAQASRLFLDLRGAGCGSVQIGIWQQLNQHAGSPCAACPQHARQSQPAARDRLGD